MKIIVLCETSNKVSQAFRDKGHEVYSLDIEANDVSQEYHIKTDLEVMIDNSDKWYHWWKELEAQGKITVGILTLHNTEWRIDR